MTRLSFILTLWTFCTFGQCTNCEQKPGNDQICWGESRSKTAEHIATFMDFSNISSRTNAKSDIDEAMNALNWLLNNAPCFHKCLYARGEKFVQRILDQETNRRTKKGYIKKLKEIKKLKTKYFGANDPSTLPCL